jgi:hypothetical protein
VLCVPPVAARGAATKLCLPFLLHLFVCIHGRMVSPVLAYCASVQVRYAASVATRTFMQCVGPEQQEQFLPALTGPMCLNRCVMPLRAGIESAVWLWCILKGGGVVLSGNCWGGWVTRRHVRHDYSSILTNGELCEAIEQLTRVVPPVATHCHIVA